MSNKIPSGTTARANFEWVGTSSDQAIPDRVKLRVFERYQGRCYLSGVKLMPGQWDIEHIKNLKAGGEHRESNMAPAARKAHKEKTAVEADENSVIYEKKRKHLLPKKQSKWPKRGFGKSEPRVKYVNGDMENE